MGGQRRLLMKEPSRSAEVRRPLLEIKRSRTPYRTILEEHNSSRQEGLDQGTRWHVSRACTCERHLDGLARPAASKTARLPSRHTSHPSLRRLRHAICGMRTCPCGACVRGARGILPEARSRTAPTLVCVLCPCFTAPRLKIVFGLRVVRCVCGVLR